VCARRHCESGARKKAYLLVKKLEEKDANFLDFANRTWELSRCYFDKFGAKPEGPCWEYGDFMSFF